MSRVGGVTERPTARRISWTAIFGGVVIVVAVQLALSLLGASIGFSTVNVNANTSPSAASASTGAAVWWLISSSVALFCGGYVAAWLAGVKENFDGWLHGLVTWAVATIVTFWLLTSAVGSLIGGGFTALSTVGSAAGSTVADAAKPIAQAAGITPDVIQQQVQGYLQPTNPNPATMSPQDAQKEMASNLVKYVAGGADAPAAKTQMVAIMAAQLKISPEEATKRFDENELKIKAARDQAVQRAKDAADASAAAVSKASLGGFFVLLIGALVAGYAGSMGVQDHSYRFNRVMATRK